MFQAQSPLVGIFSSSRIINHIRLLSQIGVWRGSLCYNPMFRGEFLVVLRFRSFLTIAIFALAFSSYAFGQTEATPTPSPSPSPGAVVAKPAGTATAAKFDPTKVTADQVIETSLILAYGYGAGRPLLNQIRKTTSERGKATYTLPDGKKEEATYQKYVIRGESILKEKIRLDQEFPNARYSLLFNDDKIVGVFNNTVFTPREDAAKAFENQIVRGLEAFLRYKENGSTVEMGAREKLMGVDYYMIDVTDKQQRKTRFYVSAKSWRVMMLTYEEGGVKYRRKFYDYNYAQGTLVPFRTVLWADDKIVEETEVGTVTFGQKVDEDMFKVG